MDLKFPIPTGIERDPLLSFNLLTSQHWLLHSTYHHMTFDDYLDLQKNKHKAKGADRNQSYKFLVGCLNLKAI